MGIIRQTKSVKAVLGQFENQQIALPVVELVSGLKSEMNKTTVYRILERLEDDGILHSFTGRDGLKWYAKCAGCDSHHHSDLHPHFHCRECGKTECLDTHVSIPTVPGFKVDSAELLLVGQCQNCLN